MALETIADAVGITKVLYTGRSNYLFHNLEWWRDQIGPNRPLLSITPDDIDEGIRVLMEGPALKYCKGAGIRPTTRKRSNGTINRYVGSLATMYKLLRQHRRLPRSFISPVVRDLKLPEAPGRTLTVSVSDVHRLIDAARLSNNNKFPALLAVACTTGLRKGSIQDLTWGAIDLKGRTLDVGRTKNGLPVRSVLPPWVCSELNRIRPDNPEKHWEVFGKKAFQKAWQNTLERAGLPQEWTFHSCRHIAASILAQSGASLLEVMTVLNHKTPSMSMRYAHLNTQAIEKAVSRAWT
jgi:integrase